MGIFLRKKKGGYYPYWLAFWQEDGKRHETTLIRWRGTPPGEGEKEGDAEFERSRGEAESLFTRLREKGRGKAEETALVQKIHAVRYGGKVKRVKIGDLCARWDSFPHKADLTEARRARVHSVLKCFERFMTEHFPRVTEVGALTAEHFKAFFEEVDKKGIVGERKKAATEGPKKAEQEKDNEEEESGVSARTWNDVLDILRGVLRRVDDQGEGFREYLANLPKRAETTIHRRPFTGAELEAIFAAAEEVDPELRPVLVAAACTALRRGDVAQLRWSDIDIAAGFVTVKTSKTGETVEIPIFPPFAVVLAEASRNRRSKDSTYVFPKVAKAYQQNADGLNVRLRKILAAAGFATPDQKDVGKYPAPPSPAEAVALVDAGMRRDKWTAKRREKGLAILQRHLNGESGKAIATELRIAKGAVSTYLHEMEDAGKIALVTPPKDAKEGLKATLAERREGEKRKHRGSLCGWHSFRTTFCSLALANGVPMELLTRITGHRTTAIVEKHYNQAKREQARQAFRNAMPQAIVGTVKPLPPVAQPPRGDDLETVTLPSNLAGLLSGASAADLERVAMMLKKGNKA